MSLLLLLRHGATHVVAAPYLPNGLAITGAWVSGLQSTTAAHAGLTATSAVKSNSTSTLAIVSGQKGATVL